MKRMDMLIASKNETIKICPIVKVAQAYTSMMNTEQKQGYEFSFDEMEEYLESWLLADYERTSEDECWKVTNWAIAKGL